MGNMIGILSTVILVSTLATLIFAVAAYLLARRRRSGVESEETSDEDIPEETEPLTVAPEAFKAEPPPPPPPVHRAVTPSATPPPPVIPPEPPPPVEPIAPPPPPASSPAMTAPATPVENKQKPLFRRLTSSGDEPVESVEIENKPGWEWE